MGVEIKPTTPVPQTHPHFKPAKHAVYVHQDFVRDVSQLRITNADGGHFRLMMLKKDLQYHQTNLIKAGCNANDLRNGIKDFYKNQFRVEP